MKTPEKKTKWFHPWPFAITVGLLIVLLVQGTLVWLANESPYQLVSEQYYQKALDYSQTMEAQTLTSQSQWRQEVQYRQTPETTHISSTLLDDKGLPVPQLQGTLHLYRPSNAKWDQDWDLKEGSAGQYVVEIPRLNEGLWELTFSYVSSAKQVLFYKKIRLDIRG
ncbi:FixH family protein [Deltaproteobacteria bacterium TL4]